MLTIAKMLSARLERLSADSAWAHRASGLRGSLLREIERTQNEHDGQPQKPLQDGELEQIVQAGFAILARAAREINAPTGEKEEG